MKPVNSEFQELESPDIKMVGDSTIDDDSWPFNTPQSKKIQTMKVAKHWNPDNTRLPS